MSVKERFNEAVTLAKSGNTAGALAILKTIDHPKARELENRLRGGGGGNKQARLQRLEDDIKNRETQQRSATIAFLFCLLLSPMGIGLFLLPIALFNYFRHKRAGSRLRAERIALMES